jgi:hypothetical protein
MKIDKDSVRSPFYRSIDLIDLFPLLHILNLFPDGCKLRRGCLDVRGLREELQHVYGAVAKISMMILRACSYQTKPTLFGLVESAEAFTGDGTAVPSLEMRLVEFECARAIDFCVFIVLDGVESGLLRDELSARSVTATS